MEPYSVKARFILKNMCTNPLKIIINNEEVTVKCGKCQTCQKEKYQDWAIKLINEAQYHTKAVFITLTFDNNILLNGNEYGADCSFLYHIKNSQKYFQKFIKRLRKHYKDKSISYYAVGEYGERTKRPHWHAIIYGVNFEEDRKETEISKSGHPQMASELLTQLWSAGRCTLQDICSNNIIYISQYSLKKYKNNEENKRYRPIMCFSNRKKISVKWVRRNYKNITKGYLEDKDRKKYKIPESYKKELKKSKKEEMKEAYRIYEENILKRLSDTNPDDIMQNQINKEKIAEYRKKREKNYRDF